MNEQTNIPNNAEIDKALKQFEAESQTGQIPKAPEALKTSVIPQKEVEGVKFDIPSYGAVKYYKETNTPKMVKMVMKYSGGAVKDQRQAEWILLGFVVVVITISGFLVFGGGYVQQKTPTILMEKMKQIETSTNQ